MLDPLNESSNQPSPAVPSWPSSPHDPSEIPAHLSPTPSPTASRIMSQQQHYHQQQQRKTSGLGGASLSRQGSYRGGGEGLPAGPSGQPEGDYGRERQIYNLPSPSLMSPDLLSSSSSSATTNPNNSNPSSSRQPNNQQQALRLPPFLRVKISTMERNRKDLLVRFDATTNLPNFRTNLYKNTQRSYVEFRLFSDQLSVGNPQTVVPALPLPSTSAITDEEDDRLVRIALQRWFSRICEDPVLLLDDELRSFVESDFGYNPIPRPRPKKKTTSTFSVSSLPLGRSKEPHDEDESLSAAKFEIGKLDAAFAECARGLEKVSKARKSLAAAEIDFGTKLVTSATTEQVPSLGHAMRKLGRALDQIAGIQHSQSVSENVVVGDTFGYQSLNARAAKETLSARTNIVEEYNAAAKVTIIKRRAVEKMKGSSSIVTSRVDDAIDEMEEAASIEQTLSLRLSSISSNLHSSLRTHSLRTHEDVAIAFLEHARMNVLYERNALKELEALRNDIKGIGVGKAVVGEERREVKPVNREGMPPTRTWVQQPVVGGMTAAQGGQERERSVPVQQSGYPAAQPTLNGSTSAAQLPYPTASNPINSSIINPLASSSSQPSGHRQSPSYPSNPPFTYPNSKPNHSPSASTSTPSSSNPSYSQSPLHGAPSPYPSTFAAQQQHGRSSSSSSSFHQSPQQQHPSFVPPAPRASHSTQPSLSSQPSSSFSNPLAASTPPALTIAQQRAALYGTSSYSSSPSSQPQPQQPQASYPNRQAQSAAFRAAAQSQSNPNHSSAQQASSSFDPLLGTSSSTTPGYTHRTNPSMTQSAFYPSQHQQQQQSMGGRDPLGGGDLMAGGLGQQGPAQQRQQPPVRRKLDPKMAASMLGRGF